MVARERSQSLEDGHGWEKNMERCSTVSGQDTGTGHFQNQICAEHNGQCIKINQVLQLLALFIILNGHVIGVFIQQLKFISAGFT